MRQHTIYTRGMGYLLNSAIMALIVAASNIHAILVDARSFIYNWEGSL